MTQTGGDGCLSDAAALGEGESCRGGVTQTGGDDDIVPSAAALGGGGVTKTWGCLAGDGGGRGGGGLCLRGLLHPPGAHHEQ